MTEPAINVSIMTAPAIAVNFTTPYRSVDGGIISGPASLTRGGRFVPLQADGSFEIAGVTIGVDFHWERRETQRFAGELAVIEHDGQLTAVNTLPLETYLASVISSEMSANAAPELLKAHAVISRSWALAMIHPEKTDGDATRDDRRESDSERVRWYDRSQHEMFDVCADDHCQRYQGLSRMSNRAALDAVKSTRAEVLAYGGKVCDARFSKCCGGAMERFDTCWGQGDYPYLATHADTDDNAALPDLTVEGNAREWILSAPPSFCNTADLPALDRAMNGYDRETADFYRWSVEYSREQLARIVAERSGIDFGEIVDLVPLERGASGRISRLKIVGTRRTMTIGKELEIRRTLSDSHLRSSAFVVERLDLGHDCVPGRVILRGAGWGHGVGLCQIGAAMMAEKGYGYREILAHYYRGATIKRLYR